MDNIELLRFSSAVFIVGLSFLATLLPILVNDISYNLFDISYMICCGCLLCLSTSYYLSQSFAVSTLVDSSSVCSALSYSLLITLVIDTLASKYFDGLINNLISIQSSMTELYSTVQNKLKFNYKPLSSSELHEFNLEQEIDTSLEEDDTSKHNQGLEDWEINNFGEVQNKRMKHLSPLKKAAISSGLSNNIHSNTNSEMIDINQTHITPDIGRYSSHLMFMMMFTSTVIMNIIEGIVLGNKEGIDYDVFREKDMSMFTSVVLRQLVTAFIFGTLIEYYEYSMKIALIMNIIYSCSTSFGIVLSDISGVLSVDTRSTSYLYTITSVIMMYYTIHHMIPTEFIKDYYKLTMNHYKLIGCTLGYVIITLLLWLFPMHS